MELLRSLLECLHQHFYPTMLEIIQKAKHEAFQLHHDSCGTEHLFLVLINSSREAGFAIRAVGISYETFHQTLLERLGRGSSKVPQVLLTKRLQKIMEFAQAEADELSELANENHLLFGLLMDESCTANKLLKDMNISRMRVLQSLYRWIKKR